MPAEPKLREARWVPSILRASLPSGLPVPAGSLFGSIAAPASGSRSGPSSTRHRCRPLPIPSGPLPWPASLPPASGFLPGSSRSIAAPLGSLPGRRPGIAARPGPRRRQSKPGPRLPPVRGSFRPEGVPVPPGSAGKWERLRLAPLPHASSLIALPLLRSLIPPLRASWLRAAAAAARSFLRSGALAPRFRPLPATR